MTCAGPLVWFDVGDPPDAALLECAACSHLVVAGSLLDAEHAHTPLLREGTATA